MERELPVTLRPARLAQPYTPRVLAGMPARGVREVTLVCPGFAVDCLETLEEIAVENRAVFMHAGGERYEYVPALNASAAHARCLADLIGERCQGWTHGAQRAGGARGPRLMSGAPLPLLGTFHELSVAVPRRARQRGFYERLGFTQATTTDTFTHPYGVLTDGRLSSGCTSAAVPPRCSPSCVPASPPRCRRLPSAGHRAHRVPHRRRSVQRGRLHGPLRACGGGARGAHLLTAPTAASRGQPVRGLCGGEPAGQRLRRRPGLLGAAGVRGRPRRRRRPTRTWHSPAITSTSPSTPRALHLQPMLVFRDAGHGARIARLREQGFELSRAAGQPARRVPGKPRRHDPAADGREITRSGCGERPETAVARGTGRAAAGDNAAPVCQRIRA